ncbi:tetratricopeptide repeat protein [Desulfocastanea catecholica]
MTENLQTLDSIGTMGASPTAKPSDPLQADYEEGKKYFENQAYGQAAVALHNALVGFTERNDQAGIANASNQLGHVCFVRGEYDSALQHYQRALDICDKSNDRMSVLAVLKKIVEVQKALNQYALAITSCLAILDHYHDNRDPQGTVTTLEEIAQLYLKLEQNEKAADTYRTIASIHKNFRHENIAASFMKKAAQLTDKS